MKATDPLHQGSQSTAFIKRWRAFAGVFLVAFMISPVSSFIGEQHTGGEQVLAFVILATFSVLYLGPLPHTILRPRASWLGVGVILAMLALMGAYLILAGPDGGTLAGFIAIAIVIAFAPQFSIPLVLVLCAGVVLVPQHVPSWNHPGYDYADATGILASSFFGLAMRYGIWNRQRLDVAQRDLETMAAEQERIRISRDLHDLLGHSLTTVTLKAELAAKLVERDPQRAAQEMQEVAALARSGLEDVRAVVAGYREVSLASELATAREVLRSAGIDAELPATVDATEMDVRELFGWVLREGVTNVVRHSRAEKVRVVLEPRGIEIADNGVGAASLNAGNGLRGLTERAAAMGGRVETGTWGGSGFRLRVEVPA